MKRINIFGIVSAVVVGLAFCQPASAQRFGAGSSSNLVDKRPENPQPRYQAVDNGTAVDEHKNRSVGSEKGYSVVEEKENTPNVAVKQPVKSPFDVNKRKAENKGEKESFRRYSQVGGVIVETTPEHTEDELILLNMKDFDLYQSPSGRTRCSARFSVVTTLPTKISNISYRLKWKNMETVLTFNNVEPGIENYFNYELLGDGCFSMDKRPNIIVNRCRVKGMTQRECASKIRWLKEI